MTTRQAITFPIWWPLRAAGAIVQLVGAALFYLGACIHDGEWPRWSDISDGFGGTT